MSATPAWRIISSREVRTRLRDKAFLAATGVTIAIVVGLVAIIAVLGGRAPSYALAVGPGVDPAVLVATEQALAAIGQEDARLSDLELTDRAQVEAAVTDGTVDAGLLRAEQGYEIVGDSGVEGPLQAGLTAALTQVVLQANAEEQQVDLGALLAGTDTRVRLLDPQADEAGLRTGIAFVFSILFFMTALAYGMTIAQSVVQEKESRIVEILAASVPIRSLLWGKIAGNTLLALGQVLLLGSVGVTGLLVTGERDLLAGVGPSMLWYVAFFLLGFVTLACLWSVAGSLATRQEDLQSTTLPGQLILLVPYFVALLAGEQVRTIFSMLPIMSTMIMPGRMAEGSVPSWQIAVAILTTVAAAVLFVRVGSRLYERTLLRTHGRLTYRQALRAADG